MNLMGYGSSDLVPGEVGIGSLARLARSGHFCQNYRNRTKRVRCDLLSYFLLHAATQLVTLRVRVLASLAQIL